MTPFKHENPSVQCGTEFAWPWALCPPLSRDESETQKQSFLLVILEPFVKWSHRVLADPCFSFLTLGGVPAGSSGSVGPGLGRSRCPAAGIVTMVTAEPGVFRT